LQRLGGAQTPINAAPGRSSQPVTQTEEVTTWG